MNSQGFFKKIGPPLAVLGILLVLYLLWKLLDLPPEEAMIEIARDYFDKYGLIVLFLSAIIEGLLLVGFYYPGSLVIFLGVILAGDDLSQVVAAVAIITAGLFIAYLINFFLGRYGWYKLLVRFGLEKPLDNATLRLRRHGLAAIFGSYWQPNLAALTSTAAGVLHYPLKRFFFYSLSAVVIWDIFWGSLVYFIGEAALNVIGIRFALAAILVWIIYRIWFDKDPKVKPQMLDF